MSVLDALQPIQPTAQQGARRIRRTLAQAFQQLESSLGQVRQILERHGSDEIQSALGSDWSEAVQLYRAMKTFVEQHNPGASIPDVPS